MPRIPLIEEKYAVKVREQLFVLKTFRLLAGELNANIVMIMKSNNGSHSNQNYGPYLKW